MSAHTPGPWAWSFFCKPDGQPIQSVDDVAETIAGSARHSDRAELFGVTLNDAYQHDDGRVTVVCYTGNGPNAHNNARLIAASPDLLAACRAVLEQFDSGALVRNTESDGVSDWALRAVKPLKALADMKAAIAKAEGR